MSNTAAADHHCNTSLVEVLTFLFTNPFILFLLGCLTFMCVVLAVQEYRAYRASQWRLDNSEQIDDVEGW